MNVFMYWEDVIGQPKPPYIQACYEQIVNMSKYEVILLDEKTIYEYVSDINENIFNLNVLAHRADYFRAKVLHENGGIWLDADALILNDLSFVENDLLEYGYVGYGYKPKEPSIGFMACRKGNKLIGDWIEGMEVKINSESYFGWTGLGYDILWKLSRRCDDMKLYPRDQFAPLTWDKWKLFFTKKTKYDTIVKKDTKAIMFYNKNMYDSLKTQTIEKIKSEDNLLGEIFTRLH